MGFVEGLGLIPAIGFGAVAVVVAGWLVVSFSPPGRRRAVVEWIAATGLYVALLSLFVHLCERALAADNHFALAAFGFLAVVFAGGGLVSLFRTVRTLRGPAKQQSSATN